MSLILLFATLANLVSNQVIYDLTAVPSEEDDLKFLSYVAEFGNLTEISLIMIDV